ncbi:MAG: DUF2130 domain-containing protein [Terriglobia bacterium]
MKEQTITCPQCGREIALSEAITRHLREELREEFERQTNEKTKELALREQSLKTRESEIERQGNTIAETIAERLKAQKEKLEQDVRKAVESKLGTQLTDLSNAVSEKEKLLEEARNTELGLRKKQREIEEKAQAAELDLTRKVDDERNKLRQEFEAANQKKESEFARRQGEITQRAKEIERAREAVEKELASREQSLAMRQGEMDRRAKSIDNTIAERLKAEKEKIEQDARNAVESELQTQLADLSNAVGEKEKLLEQARNTELGLRKKQREIEEKAQTRELDLTRKLDEERNRLREEFESANQKKESEIMRRQEEIAEKAKEVERARDEVEVEVANRLHVRQEEVEREIRTKLDSKYSVELQDLKAQNQEKAVRLVKAQEAELELRKQRRQLEDAKQAFELEMNRKLDEERERIREDAANAVTEDYRIKELEREKLIEELKKQMEELKRKAEQGSEERQGEAMEIELENVLKSNFPLDEIEPVLRGRKGADILQRIRNGAAQHCGTIIWESKRTKNWNEGWVDKLRDDQREAKADIAALLTTTLPQGVDNFGYYNGVWVTNHACLAGLATALRISLIHIAENNIAASGKTQKMEVLYNYFSGPIFRQKIEGIVEPFKAMQDDLDAEKRAMGRIWAKREKQIERVINNAVTMYGDVQGIIGASLPEIKSLDLKALAPADETNSTTGITDDVSS